MLAERGCMKLGTRYALKRSISKRRRWLILYRGTIRTTRSTKEIDTRRVCPTAISPMTPVRVQYNAVYIPSLTSLIEDQRSIANRLAREGKRAEEPKEHDLEKQRIEHEATLPGKAHGNKPSRGAEIDQELREEEEQMLKKKGGFGPKH
jgi:hypothetical protein